MPFKTDVISTTNDDIIQPPIAIPQTIDEPDEPDEPDDKKPTLTMAQKLERLIVNISWFPVHSPFLDYLYRFDVKKASGFSLRDELTSFQIYCIIFL